MASHAFCADIVEPITERIESLRHLRDRTDQELEQALAVYMRELLTWLDTGASLRFFELNAMSYGLAARALELYASIPDYHQSWGRPLADLPFQRAWIEASIPSATQTLVGLNIATVPSSGRKSPTESFRRDFARIMTQSSDDDYPVIYARAKPDLPFYTIVQDSIDDVRQPLLNQASMIFFASDITWRQAIVDAQLWIATILETGSLIDHDHQSPDAIEDVWWLAQSDQLDESVDQIRTISLLPAKWRSSAPWSWPETSEKSSNRGAELRILLQAYAAVTLSPGEIEELVAAGIDSASSPTLTDVVENYDSIRDEVRNWGRKSRILL
ncbi:hypothetical protein Namu_2709 [Nakamurella multipartita DSM 44233]|uniref:Uncharacterized protein n=2 Tax=Nakamurella TaxID=53460 RepID=C8X8K0_NAKMY|nr:hypothetical protein Namu_2709 [Nakamurella multipartita DSM 44233]